jgi:hypothetical protein
LRTFFVVSNCFPHLDKAQFVFLDKLLFGAKLSLKVLDLFELSRYDGVLFLQFAIFLDVHKFKLLSLLGCHLSQLGFLLFKELVNLL